MITVGERCFELSWPRWQPPAGDGLVALVDGDLPAVWVDRLLLARHSDGFVVWAATGAQPAWQALAVAQLPEVRAVTVVSTGVDARQAGLALEFACRLAIARVDQLGPRQCHEADPAEPAPGTGVEGT